MKHGWRMTGRLAALFIALMMIAVPAAAAVVTQNFMKGEATSSAACFTKVAGADASSGFLTFVGGNTVTPGAPGVDLLQETVQFDGYAGDRVIYTDAVQFANACGHDIDVLLRVEADPEGNGPIAGLGGFHIEISLWDTGLADWDTPIVVHNGAVATAVSGSVTIADGTSVPMRISVDTDAAGGTDGTLYWTAEASHP